MPRHPLLRPARLLPLALVPVLVACGGGSGTDDDAGADGDDPTTTTTATAADDPAGSERVEVAGGFLSIAVPDGWEIVVAADEPPSPALLGAEEEWAPADPPVQDLIEVTDGSTNTFLAVEPLYEVAPEDEWAAMIVEALRSEGAALDRPVESTWAGEPSLLSTGRAGDRYVEVELARVGSQLVAALTNAPAPLDEDEAAEIEAMLDSVTFDESVLGPLHNGLEAGIYIGPENTSQGEFMATTAVPLDWTVRPGEEPVGQVFRGGPDDQAYLHLLPVHAQGPFGAQVQDELDAIPAELRAGLVREAATVDDVSLDILREGEAGEAVSGMVYASDGVVFLGVYLDTVDDPQLFEAIIDRLRFPLHH